MYEKHLNELGLNGHVTVAADQHDVQERHKADAGRGQETDTGGECWTSCDPPQRTPACEPEITVKVMAEVHTIQSLISLPGSLFSRNKPKLIKHKM